MSSFLPEVFRLCDDIININVTIYMEIVSSLLSQLIPATAYRVTVTSAFPERLIMVSLPSVFASPADTEAAATFTRRTE